MTRRNSAARTATLGVLLLASGGCATIGTRAGASNRRVIDTRTEEVPSNRLGAEIQQDGTLVNIRLVPLCAEETAERVEVTTEHERYNATPERDWIFGIAGGGLLLGGTAVLIDSPNVHGTDRNSRTYNSVGQDRAIAIGAGMAALGVAALAVATVDVVRAQGGEQRVQELEQRSPKPGPHHACKNASPPPITPLALAFSQGSFPLGDSSPSGQKQFDLASVIPDNVPVTPGQVGELSTGETILGTVQLDPLHAIRDAVAWTRVDIGACKEPKVSTDCAAVRDYLQRFPTGNHAREAQRLLAASRQTLEQLRDDEAWAKVSTQECTDPSAKDIEMARYQCHTIEEYLKQFPAGRHVEQARAALKRGKASIERVEKQIAREEEAKERQAEQEFRACMRDVCDAYCKVKHFYNATARQGCFQLCMNSRNLEHKCQGW